MDLKTHRDFTVIVREIAGKTGKLREILGYKAMADLIDFESPMLSFFKVSLATLKAINWSDFEWVAQPFLMPKQL